MKRTFRAEAAHVRERERVAPTGEEESERAAQEEIIPSWNLAIDFAVDFTVIYESSVNDFIPMDYMMLLLLLLF